MPFSVFDLGRQKMRETSPSALFLHDRAANSASTAGKAIEQYFLLHKGQQAVVSAPEPFKVLTCGRRWGKTRLQLVQALKVALGYQDNTDPLSPVCVLVGMPTLKECKKKFFWPLIEVLDGHPLVSKIDRTNFIIWLKGGRPAIYFCGLNDGVRGDKIIHAVVDEVQDVRAGIVDDVLLPALADTPGSTAIFTGTPKGKRTAFYELFSRGEKEQDWRSFTFSSYENPHLPERFRRILEVLEPRIHRQEALASWEDFQGKVFSEFTQDHIVGQVPSTFDRVFGGVDWGDVNYAFVVIGQVGDCYYLLDEWSNTTGQPVVDDVFLEHIERASLQWNVYRWYCDPSRPASIYKMRLPRADTKSGRPNGMQRAVKGVNSIRDGLTIINSLCFQGRFKVRSQCSHFASCMDSYHRLERDGVVLDAIADGQDDHVLDAARYVLATLQLKSFRIPS